MTRARCLAWRLLAWSVTTASSFQMASPSCPSSVARVPSWWRRPTAADALVVVLVPLAGAFRLARFNLLPPKTTSHTDSLGLTISTSGALLALAVLSNLAGAVAPSPILYLGVTVGVSLLMVSTIAFPSLAWIFAGWRTTGVVLGLMGVSLVGLSFFTAWLVWTSAYVGIALARAGARRVVIRGERSGATEKQGMAATRRA